MNPIFCMLVLLIRTNFLAGTTSESPSPQKYVLFDVRGRSGYISIVMHQYPRIRDFYRPNRLIFFYHETVPSVILYNTIAKAINATLIDKHTVCKTTGFCDKKTRFPEVTAAQSLRECLLLLNQCLRFGKDTEINLSSSFYSLYG